MRKITAGTDTSLNNISFTYYCKLPHFSFIAVLVVARCCSLLFFVVCCFRIVLTFDAAPITVTTVPKSVPAGTQFDVVGKHAAMRGVAEWNREK